MTNTNRVEEPSVGGARKTDVCKSQLFDRTQALKFSGINNSSFAIAEHNTTVNGVSDFYGHAPVLGWKFPQINDLALRLRSVSRGLVEKLSLVEKVY